MITKRRLPGMEGYGGELLGPGPRQLPAPMGGRGGSPGGGLPSPSPVPPMGLPDQPMDPMAAINPMNADSYMGLKKRRLGGL